MALPPEFFRGMDPAQIALALTIEETVARGAQAKAAGASCVDCCDTGLNRQGVFCGCAAGGRLGFQGARA